MRASPGRSTPLAAGSLRGARLPGGAPCRWAWLAVLLLVVDGAAGDEVPKGAVRTLTVTATAYNSIDGQTHGNPTITAWGDRLEPGMKAIAVSRDLIDLGLDHGVHVEIEGLPGVYTVRDKMARRWSKKIDIYMGRDVEAARVWGRRKVEIRWRQGR
jgi:3D (Asp-Asp-Asp) domain-containing protein